MIKQKWLSSSSNNVSTYNEQDWLSLILSLATTRKIQNFDDDVSIDENIINKDNDPFFYHDEWELKRYLTYLYDGIINRYILDYSKWYRRRWIILCLLLDNEGKQSKIKTLTSFAG